jgi:hypothetical protein
MRNRKEFIIGEDYSVDLRNAETGKRITFRYVKAEYDLVFVTITSNFADKLFDLGYWQSDSHFINTQR